MSEHFTALIVGDNITELPKSTLPASAADEAGHYPFFCSSAEVKATTAWLQEKPTVLMGTGGVASVNYGEDRFAYSTDTWGFRSSNAKLSTKFLFQKIQQYLPRIDYAGFEGSGLRHLRKDFIKKLRIDVPSPIVQSRMVEIIDSHDLAIAQIEALIAKYQQIKAGLMHDLFTRGVTADSKLRPPREQAPELYQETPIGWIPKEWGTEKLKDMTEILTCGVAATPEYVESSVGIPFLSAQNVNEGKVILRRFSYIPLMLHKQLTKYSKPKKGDILYSRVGAGFGEAAVVEFDWEFSVYVSLTLIRMRKNYDNYFYKYLLNSRQIKNKASIDVYQGGGVPNLNVKAVREFLLPVPSHEEQILIAKQLKAVDQKIDGDFQALEKLEKQKLGLMHDLLTGKVRVNPESKAPEMAVG